MTTDSTPATAAYGIERELEAMNVVDNLLVLMKELPGWDFNAADHAFSYLRRMHHAYPEAPLTLSIANELRLREALNGGRHGEQNYQ